MVLNIPHLIPYPQLLHPSNYGIPYIKPHQKHLALLVVQKPLPSLPMALLLVPFQARKYICVTLAAQIAL